MSIFSVAKTCSEGGRIGSKFSVDGNIHFGPRSYPEHCALTHKSSLKVHRAYHVMAISH